MKLGKKKSSFISKLKHIFVNFYSVYFLPPVLQEGMLLVNYIVCAYVTVETIKSVQCITVL